MSSLLPAPVHAYKTFQDEKIDDKVEKKPSSTSLVAPRRSEVPSYPHRVQQKFVPRAVEDFGDGGAYPEIHLAQFPLNMGKKGGSGGAASASGSANNTLALQVRGEDGHVSYDAIVTQHHRDKAKVFTKFSDIVEKDDKPRALPTKEEEMETASRTKDALQQLIQGKISAAHPVNINRQKTAKETSTYIRYTPHDQGKMGGQSQQRIIRMVEVAQDPMEPPKFQHKKAVRGPPSPPVPVLHSPPRKLTVKDQQSWKIPPVISNWKNSKGFTIALDKRLAADGRGLQQATVNDNFASLAEALAIAERKAREEVNVRAQVQKKLAMMQKEQKENELREMAQKARMERAGIRGDDQDERHDGRGQRGRGRSYSRSRSRSGSDRDSGSDRGGSGSDDERARRERDQIRHERKKDREREMRMEKIGKKGKLARDEDRDVSEKIALGQLQGTGKLSGEAMFDSRLFNQSQGLGSGFGAEDDYGVYSKPMVDRGKASVYRPKADDSAYANADKDYEDLKGGHSKRFKADKGFRGTEEVGRGRDGPVQFSYDDQKKEDDVREREEDRRGRGGDESKEDRFRSRRSPSRSRSLSRSPSPPPRSKARARSNSRRRQSPSRSRSRGRAPVKSRRRSPSHSRSRSRDRDRKRSRRSRSRSRGASSDSSDDPYGLDQFLSDARKSTGSKKASPPRRR